MQKMVLEEFTFKQDQTSICKRMRNPTGPCKTVRTVGLANAQKAMFTDLLSLSDDKYSHCSDI